VAAIEIGNAVVVLHDQSPTAGHEIQQLLIICGQFFLRVISAYAKNDGPILREIFCRQLVCRDQRHIHPDLL
jgi:hypothetical protein